MVEETQEYSPLVCTSYRSNNRPRAIQGLYSQSHG